MDQETSSRMKRAGSALLAGIVGVFSVRSLQQGKRVRGVLTGIGALALGYTAATGGRRTADRIEVDATSVDTSQPDSTATETATETTDESTSVDGSATDDGTSAVPARASAQLTCAACGEPITLGQRRGPNDEGEIVHAECA
ncbi:MAG: DUF2892 domain-containing protein [Halorientalis sp.]